MTKIYRGIPFATAERFENPVLIDNWKEMWMADSEEVECPQLSAYTDDSERFYTKEFREGVKYCYAESPLTMNIIAPENAENCPVFLFFHGGGFFTGKQSEFPFGSSDEYAKRGIILVSAGYRLNVFGLYEQQNYCLRDMAAAVDWVRKYISEFGGDGGNITVGGQSAGAIATMELLYSDILKDKVRGAIMMSGAGFFPNFGRPWTKAEAEPFWKKVEAKAGCSSKEELKKIPAETLWRAWWDVKQNSGSIHLLQSGIDGELVPDTPAAIKKSGKMLDLPVLVGVTSQDMFFAAIIFDIAKNFALWSSRKGRKPVYCYLFDRRLPGNRYSAFHAADLWYVFGNMDKSWRPFGEKDFRIRDEMADAFAKFVKEQDPGWEAVTKSHRKFRYFGDKERTMISKLQALPTLLWYSIFERGPM